MWQTLTAIAAGGAVGSLARYWVSGFVHRKIAGEFPWGTLTVNVAGSLLMGLLFVLFVERMNVSLETRALVLTGFLGAFTTFSTFSIETLSLLENGAVLKAMTNMVLSVTACVLAAWVGLMLGRQL